VALVYTLACLRWLVGSFFSVAGRGWARPIATQLLPAVTTLQVLVTQQLLGGWVIFIRIRIQKYPKRATTVFVLTKARIIQTRLYRQEH
jgi:hypothetical protein